MKKKILKSRCKVCKNFAAIRWNKKYNGFRAICEKCGNQWPES